MPPSENKEIRRIRSWQWFALAPFAFLQRLWTRSLRFRLDPAEHALITDTSEPQVLLIWHNRLFTAAEIYKRFRQGRTLFALVSASRDGGWLEAYFQLVGMGCVRGSSSRRATEASRSLLKHIKAGNDIAITPDGPRGPRYEVKPGATFMARLSRAPLLLISVNPTACFTLKSWDRFQVPLPFSIVNVRAQVVTPDELLPREKDADKNAAARILRDRLMKLCNDPAMKKNGA